LDLTKDEVPVFQRNVDKWILGVADPLSAIFNIQLRFLPHWKALRYLQTQINDKIDTILAEEDSKNNNNNNDDRSNEDTSTLREMVFAVGEDGRKLTRKQIIDNVMILILAGSETSASTLAQCLLALKLNPRCWAALVKEQQSMMEKYGNTMSKKTLDEECPYLDATIRETLRMLSLPSGAPRRIKDNITLVVDGYELPPGIKVMFSPLMTHYNDPITYQEDGSHMDIQRGYRPERWLDDETRPTTEFIPMGSGPRYCLGATLAYAEMKVFLATLARTVDYRLLGSYEDGIVWKRTSILPKPADGIPVEITVKNKEDYVVTTEEISS
jgi:cytochrome P450